MNAAAPKARDFAMIRNGMDNERVHTVPIKAAAGTERSSAWARMKVTAFGKIGGKG